MFLSDTDIEKSLKVGHLRIWPWDESHLQPASVDLTLSRFFKTMKSGVHGLLDTRQPVEYNDVEVPEGKAFVLGPGAFVLGSTVEHIELPVNLIGRLEGKSSLGRLGLTAHITAGFFDPGFRGTATLELHNVNDRAIQLWPGMKICQMSFAMTVSQCRRPYGHPELGSRYQDQGESPQGSLFHTNFNSEEHNDSNVGR